MRAIAELGHGAPGDGFDTWLLEYAHRGGRALALADAYSRRWAPASALRRRLVLLLAVVETGPDHRLVDELPRRSLPVVLLSTCWSAGWGVLLALEARLRLGGQQRRLGGGA